MKTVEQNTVQYIPMLYNVLGLVYKHWAMLNSDRYISGLYRYILIYRIGFNLSVDTVAAPTCNTGLRHRLIFQL